MAAPRDLGTIDVHLADGGHLAVVYAGNDAAREAVQDAVIETVLRATGDMDEICALIDERMTAMGRTAARSNERSSEVLTID